MKLRPLDADYLLRVLELAPELRERLVAFRERRAELSPADRDDLRELVADRLMLVGFDEKSEPTPEGRRLEDLIDALYTG